MPGGILTPVRGTVTDCHGIDGRLAVEHEESNVKYRAFISYSHSDFRIARRLHRWLESYRMPARLVGRSSPLGTVPGRLHPIFRDREELPTSADLGEQIGTALRDSETLIVICSPRSAASRWVNEEILAYKRLGRSGRILCLIVDGEPNATDKPGLEAAECFAPALRFQLAEDGRLSTVPAEPIAADMRPGKDGRRDAWLKLVAGVAGVGFDELKQRELQRQLRRAIAISVASLLLLVTMAGLTVAAVLSRREAVRQRAIAATERDRAEQNFHDARDAVDRFYTKVSEEQLLKAEGLQPLRADLLKEALTYYKRFLSQRKDDPAFALESAIVQGNVGGILSEVGDPEEALQATHDATLALNQLHAATPGDVQITAQLSKSLGDEAVNLHRLGRVEEALAAHNGALTLFESLPEGTADRTIVEWQRLLTTKAAFLAQLGRFDEAAKSYERGLEVADRIAKELAPLGIDLKPASGGLVVVGVRDRSPAATAGIRAGDAIKWIADVEPKELADMAAVRGRLKAGVAVPVGVVRGGEPVELAITPVYLGDFMTASTKYNLGYLYLERLRQPEKAKPWLIESVDEYRRTLLRESSASPNVRDGLAFAAGVLGTCGHRLGDGELQERGMREGVAAAEENVRANPSVPRYRTTLAVNLANLAMLLKERGDLDGAASLCQTAVENLQAALQLGGNLPSDQFQLMQLLTNLGSIISAKDGPAASLPIYESALEAAAAVQAAAPSAQMLPLALAQLHRNYGSGLRAAGRLRDAAAAYETAARRYDDVVSATPTPPAWLLQESATLECWRAALCLRLHDAAAAATMKEAFEARCARLGEGEDGVGRLVRARLAAVEAYVDAAMGLLPDDARGAADAIPEAEEQLEQFRREAAGHATDTALAEALSEADRIIRGARLRAGLCSEERSEAWRVFFDCLAGECVESLPLPSRVDLAAGLIMAGKDAESEGVLSSLKKAVAAGAAPQKIVAEGLVTLRECGVPDAVVARIGAATSVLGKGDAER